MPKCGPQKKPKNENLSPTTHASRPGAKKTVNHKIPKGVLCKKHVPKDDSCLFNSIYFLLNGKLDQTGHVAPHMRQLVAEVIKHNPEYYNKAILGKTVPDYCHWIMKKTSWGGAIEISILASYYGIEIVVVDCITGAITIFGEDECFAQRAFLLYNGTHYDPLYLKSSTDGSIYTIFRRDNQKIFTEAKQVGKKESLKFIVRKEVDRKGLILKCVAILYILVIYVYFSLCSNLPTFMGKLCGILEVHE